MVSTLIVSCYRTAAGPEEKLDVGSTLTCDFGFEGTCVDVIWSSIFNADQVVPRSHGSVLHFVAIWDLVAFHFHFGWTLNAYSQGSRTRLGVVDNELGLSTYRISAETSFFW